MPEINSSMNVSIANDVDRLCSDDRSLSFMKRTCPQCLIVLTPQAETTKENNETLSRVNGI